MTVAVFCLSGGSDRAFNVMRSQRVPMKRIVTVTLILLVISCAAYGVVRWRKLIVMGEYDQKEQSLLIRETIQGWDVRDDWKGRLKNQINGPVFIFFRPLELLENHLRGFRKHLPLSPT
jgi:hypothetical protein